MSVYETNVTYDYTDYYGGKGVISPCDDMNLKDFGRVFLPTFYCLVFVLGFLGNGLVVCVLVKHRHQAALTDICLLNLAVSDILFVLTLPFYANFAMLGRWIFGGFVCRFIAGCQHAGFISSVLFMIAMTVDRYLAIVYTHKVARHRTPRAGLYLSAFLWLLSLCVSLPIIIFTKVIERQYGGVCEYSPDNSSWKFYNILITNILGLMIPLLVMMGCYSRILPVVLNMKSVKKHRAIKLIVTVIAAFFLFWAPYNVSIFLKVLQYDGKLSDECHWQANLNLAVTVTETIAYSHCCLNPIIYAFVGQTFMKRAVQMLRKFLPCTHLSSLRGVSEMSFWRSSASSRSSEVSSTLIM